MDTAGVDAQSNGVEERVTQEHAAAAMREWLAQPNLAEYLRSDPERALDEFSRVNEFSPDVAQSAYRDAVRPARTDTAPKAGPFTKVPSELLGPVLDHGKPSAFAAHLLAIKHHFGSGFVLNNKHCKETFGISDHGFRKAGLPLLKRTGTIERKQPGGRKFAIEKLAEPSGRGYVDIPDTLLTQSSDLVGFVLAIKLSPRAAHPNHFARRIGIKSPKTVRHLLKAIDELERAGISIGVQRQEGPRGRVEIGRDGAKFTQVDDGAKSTHVDDLGKNDRGKNHPGIKRPAHTTLEGCTTDVSGKAQESERDLPHDTRSPERAGVAKICEESLQAKSSDNLIGPEWRTLADWRASNFFRERQLFFEDDVPATDIKPVMTLTGWSEWLEWFGGAPGHLATSQAHMQALQISSELTQFEGCRAGQHSIMVALAFEICRASATGKDIRSLALIAEPLFRRSDNGDFAWVYNRPTRLGLDKFNDAYALAVEAATVLDEIKFPFDREVMFSTAQVERLYHLIHKFGRNTVVHGMNRAIKGNHRPPEGQRACCWTWFEDEIIEASRGTGSGTMQPRGRVPRQSRKSRASAHPY